MVVAKPVSAKEKEEVSREDKGDCKAHRSKFGGISKFFVVSGYWQKRKSGQEAKERVDGDD